MRNRKLDVIIPAYKGHKTIWQTISSIASQTIISDIETTIVNDCCPGGNYQEFVKMFSPYMKIKEVNTDKNGGPGVARQKGIDSTNNEYIAFIDDDDVFYSATAIETLRNAIEEPVISANGQLAQNSFAYVTSPFIESAKSMFLHPNGDTIYMHGKLYRRDFLDKYKVHFSELRAGEDVGFNTWVRMLCNMPENLANDIDVVTYLYKDRADSVSRINNYQYQYDKGFCGLVDNLIYAFKHVQSNNIPNSIFNKFLISRMIILYYDYISCLKDMPVFAAQAWEYIKKFYHAVYEPAKNAILDQELFNEFAIDSVNKKLRNNLMYNIFSMSIQEFMRKLETEEYNSTNIPEELKQNVAESSYCPE